MMMLMAKRQEEGAWRQGARWQQGGGGKLALGCDKAQEVEVGALQARRTSKARSGDKVPVVSGRRLARHSVVVVVAGR